MISIKNNKLLNLLILLVIIVLIFIIINSEINENYNNTNEYKLGKLLYESKRSLVYEIDKINNKISKNYLYKKILIMEQTEVETQVKINNAFKYSPTIIDYGKDYYIIEKYDSTLENLVLNKKFNKEKLKYLIKVLREYNKYKYNIDDLHTNNIVWSDKKKTFGIIDWDIIETKDARIDNNLDNIKFIEQFIFKRCKIISSKQMNEYIDLFNNIYNNRIDETEILNTFKNIENKT